MYYETYNAVTNPGGATPAGWYPVFGSMPVMMGSDKGTTTTPNNTWTFLNTGFGSGTTFRNNGFVFGTDKIDVPIPGLYQIEATVRFSPANTGEARLVRLWGDQSSVYSNLWLRMAAGSTWSGSQVQSLHISGLVPCASSFSVQTYQNSGSNNSVLLQDVSAEFRGVRRA
uniref:Minor tail protein n=1 Tax=Microbacterium phage Sunny TaxID=3144828 RepID=A0AAU7J7R7_9VIRU